MRSWSRVLLEWWCAVLCSSWMEKMRVEKAVEPYLLDASTHAAFLSSILTGPNPPPPDSSPRQKTGCLKDKLLNGNLCFFTGRFKSKQSFRIISQFLNCAIVRIILFCLDHQKKIDFNWHYFSTNTVKK